MNGFKAKVFTINGRTGRRRESEMILPMEARPLYDEMVKAGCYFETESWMAGQILSVISNGKKEIACRTTEAGPTVQRALVDMLIGKPWNPK